jgi:hypothetical protein
VNQFSRFLLITSSLSAASGGYSHQPFGGFRSGWHGELTQSRGSVCDHGLLVMSSSRRSTHVITPVQHLGVVAARIQRGGDRLNSVRIRPPAVVAGFCTRSVLLSTMNSYVITADFQLPQPGSSPHGPPVGPPQSYGY